MPQIQSLLKTLDADGSNTISLEELENAPHELRETLREIDVRTMFDVLDVDGAGEVDIDEFCYALLQLCANSATFDDLRRSKYCASIHATASQVFDYLDTHNFDERQTGNAAEDRRRALVAARQEVRGMALTTSDNLNATHRQLARVRRKLG